MNKRLAKSAALIALCFSSALAQKPDWKEYEYPDDGFAISTPFKPVFQKEFVDTEAGKMEMHNYSVNAGPLWSVLVSVNDLSKFGDLPARDLLQAAKNGSVAEAKGKLISEREILRDGAPGIEYEIGGINERSVARCYYVNGRTLTLISAVKKDFSLFPDVDRFFNSVRFIPAWKDYAYGDDGFVISAPSKAELQKKSVDTPAGPVEMHMYSIHVGDDTGLIISVTDYGKGNKLATDALQLTKNAALQSTKAKLVAEKNILLQDNAGLEFELQSDTYRSRSRYFIVGSKLIAIVSYAGEGRLLPPGTARMLDSLHLFEAQRQ